MPIPYQKVFLIVLDGFGLAEREKGNAILAAGMPFVESLVATYPCMSVAASGLIVGLPWGQPGNSEVGHSAIGTGRVVIQDLASINQEIRTGDFYKNKPLLAAFEHAKKHDSTLHFIGCTSPGGIHSHTDHLLALLDLAQRYKLKQVRLHFIADGQDMPPQDAVHVVASLRAALDKANGAIASVMGRSYAMDRILNWKLTERVWHAVVLGDAPGIEDPEAYLKAGYAKGLTDYGIEPATVMRGGKPVGPLEDNDALIFFDFRNDRVRQLATPFVMPEFKDFDRVRYPKNVHITTMTKYAEEFTVPFAFPAPELPNNLGEMISKQGWRQWRIAEKEKEAHVTNFINGGRIEPFPGEQREIVSSRPMRGEEYLEHPEMSAQKIVDSVLGHAADDARLYFINFANPDMIGHTGNLQGTVKAMQILDAALEQLIGKLSESPGNAIIITADHGNAEELLDPLTGAGDTQHSTRNVPAIFITRELKEKGDGDMNLEKLAREAPLGTLVDIAPTALYLLGLEQPTEMTGSPLVKIP
jgi:2,3-bisphosphoglycerate-independent phosphoglycerate mutase